MKKRLLPSLFMTAVCIAAFSNATMAQTKKPETPVLGKDEYRMKLDEVIVIGQEPYWRKEAPRWDRGKVELDTKPAQEPRLQLFPNYTAEERDDALKAKDRNNATPLIKIFEKKF
jgi:hypothetical protein